MQYYRVIGAAIVAISLLSTPAMAGHIAVKKDEVKFALGMRKNMGSYIRLSGILTDVLRSLKTEYSKMPSAADNAVTRQAEDMLNEAGLAASQDDFEGSFAIMEKVSTLILDAIDKFNSQN
ncbi:MAG: hypothetical protein OEZ32_09030 [Nitrospinota bacterium]|nr:hypothetical protein [Nitrospinota bacterium]